MDDERVPREDNFYASLSRAIIHLSCSCGSARSNSMPMLPLLLLLLLQSLLLLLLQSYGRPGVEENQKNGRD